LKSNLGLDAPGLGPGIGIELPLGPGLRSIPSLNPGAQTNPGLIQYVEYKRSQVLVLAAGPL